MDEWKKRSGQIPAFGNWDLANELPITQYFECARQAGLVRYSNSSSTSGEADRYALHNNNMPHSAFNLKHRQAMRNCERRCPHVYSMVKEKEYMNVMTRKQGKVYDVVTEQPRKPIRASKLLHQHDTVPRSSPPRPPKPVDEDLYKIPPELLHTTKRKRKKVLGFISKCLVPAACVS